MKRSILFSVGVGMVVVARALGVSDYSANHDVQLSSAEFGLVNVTQLTDEQRARLQDKFRYWASSQQEQVRAPR